MTTAIIVRGNARTWNYINYHNIELFNNIYNYPDWYIAFPATSTVTVESLTEDFRGSNLRSIQLIPDQHYPWNYPLSPGGNGQHSQEDYLNWKLFIPAYWRQAWLEYMAGLAKRKYELENNIRYTNVLGFRPDNWFEIKTENFFDIRKDLDTLAITHTNYSGDLSFNDWRTSDFFWRAGSAAADLYCLRYLDTYITDNIPGQLIHYSEQSLPCYYQARSFIDGRVTFGNVKEYIITPNAPFPWSPELFNNNFYKTQWHELSLSERYQICVDLKIDPRDYQVDLSING
jgi:hypothetical protein